MVRERKKSKKDKNLPRSFCTRLISGLTRMAKKDLTDKEYIAILEKRITKTEKLLDISEAQKAKLKERNTELQRKIAEILRNSS